MVSVLFIGGSVAIYNSFSSSESQLQLRVLSSTVSALVEETVRNGSAEATVSLPATTFDCTDAAIRLTTSSGTVALASPLPCSFGFDVTAGTHVLQFAIESAQLVVRVV